MKKTIFVVAALAALVASSVAVATLRSSSVSPVSATLSAPTTVHVSTRTVTCDGQTIEISTGRYTGTVGEHDAGSRRPGRAAASTASTTRRRSSARSTARCGSARPTTARRRAFTAINSDGKLDGWLRGSAGHRDGADLRQPLRLVQQDRRPDRRPARHRHRREYCGAREAGRVQEVRDDPPERAPDGARRRSSRSARRRAQGQAGGRLRLADLHGQASASRERIEKGDKVEMTCVQRERSSMLEKVRERR